MPLEFLRGKQRTRWNSASFKFRRANPWCLGCFAALGIATRAALVDHVIPHKGDREKFWNERNLQPCCIACHGIKAMLEDQWRRGLLPDSALRLDSKAAIRLIKLYHRPRISITGEPIPGT
jgi:5-methylcytosine-specific restriction endonuclease McrA